MEGRPSDGERKPEDRHMDEQSNSADKGEQAKTNRNDMANQLIGDQHHVFPGDERIEFALAMQPFAELQRQLGEDEGPRG